ncbi:hypothetical protein GEMRC1_013852 [Eukaryota sp. GEM-RC1]
MMENILNLKSMKSKVFVFDFSWFKHCFEDKKPRLPTSFNHMITFTFKNGALITLRTSGTELKVKFYSELSADTAEEAREKLTEMIEKLLEHWIRLQKFIYLEPN